MKSLAAGLLLMSTAPAYASVPLDYFDLPPEQLLDARVFSATKTNEKLSDIPAAVFVLTQEDMLRSGATTIPEALRLVPGVQVARSDANTWAVSIRGFNAELANKILVLIDGRTIYNPLHSGTYWEAQDLLPENIERIEVIRGPGGTLWGANAMNGVINIITKNARDTQGTLISHGHGNHERGFIGGYHGGQIGDAHYRVSGKYFKRDSFSSAADPDTDSPDESKGYRAGFRMDWAGSNDQITANGNIYRTGADQFAESFSLSAPYSLVTEEETTSHGAHLLGRWSHDFNDGGRLNVQSFVDYTVRDQELLKDDRVIFDVESQYNFRPLGRHEIVTGLGYRYMVDNLAGSNLVSFSPASRKDPLYSAFIQDKIALIPQEWYLTLGTKLEHNHYTGVEIQPNARLSWIPDDRQTVWASASRAVRTPSRIERDLSITNLVAPPGSLPAPLDALPVQVDLMNNKSYGTEKLTAYEIGYRNQITPTVSFDAAAFVNNYHDLFTFDALPATIAGGPPHVELPLIASNEMSAETYGIELAASWNVSGAWTLSAAYSYLEMFLHAPELQGLTQESDEGESPIHQANIRSSWDITRDWSLDTAVYYVDELKSFDAPAYVRLDMNLGWRVGDNLHINIIGQNLLNNERTEFDSDDVNASEIGTSVFGKMTWTF